MSPSGWGSAEGRAEGGCGVSVLDLAGVVVFSVAVGFLAGVATLVLLERWFR